MAAKAAGKRQFRFSGGIHTESGYLTPAPNTWADGVNVIPAINGEIGRRTRLDFEDADQNIATVTANDARLEATSAGLWTAVAGRGDLNFYCVQHGATLCFGPNVDPMSGTPTFTIDLTPYQVANTPKAARLVQCQYVTGLGKFFVTSAAINPLMLTLNDDEVSVTIAPLLLRVRDFDGAADGLADKTRPSTISPAHYYNLKNQGWAEPYITYFLQGGQHWDDGTQDLGPYGGYGAYPSNVDRMSWGEDSGPLVVSRGVRVWAYDGVVAVAANREDRAPRGHYIIDPFSQDRATASGIAGVPTSTAIYTRPTTIAFHGGRAWYAGIASKTIGSWVLFSQVGEGSSKFSNCFQAGDPHSGNGDILDSDGGVIPINEAGTILKLAVMKDLIVVICDNGVWQIGSDGGFKATGYSVNKVTNFGCVGADTVVEVGDKLMYWSDAGIILLQLNDSQVTLQVAATSVTDLNIATFYQNINAISRKFAKGIYHQDAKLIYWGYYNGTPDGTTYMGKKNAFLIFDTRLQAWYPFSIDDNLSGSNDAWFVDMVVSSPISRGEDITVDVVTDDDVDTVIADGEQVTVSLQTLQSHGRVLKLFAYKTFDGSFHYLSVADFETSEYRPDRYRDWFKVDQIGLDYPVYVETQWEEDGVGADKRMGTHYATVFCKKTEAGLQLSIIDEFVNEDDEIEFVYGDAEVANPGSVLMQSRWDFSDIAASGKWSAYQQVYRHLLNVPAVEAEFNTPLDGYDTGSALVITKNKIRGRGRALKLRFKAEPDKDMRIVGWAITNVGNTAE